MPTMRPKTGMRARERDKKTKWLRKLRQRLQHFSLVLRPQTIRAIWVKDFVLKEAEQSKVSAV